jgi:hypothetical protein
MPDRTRKTKSAAQELPEDFQDLTPFLKEWDLATERERHAKRVGSRLEDVRRFYDAMTPHIHGIVAHLARFPGADPDALPPAERKLYNLALAFMECSHPIDLKWQRPDIDDAFPVDRMEYLAPIDMR